MAQTTSDPFRVQIALPSQRPTLGTLDTIYDGMSGLSWQQWDFATQIPWRNPGGDWLDRNRVPQGATPFATADVPFTSFPGANPIALSGDGMIELVNRWRSRNTGAAVNAIRRIGTISFHHRESSTRPALTVTASGQSIPCRCIAFNSGNVSISGPRDWRQAGGVETADSGARAFVAFDVSAIPRGATLTAATLTLSVRGTFDFPGSATIGLFEVDAPHIWTSPSEAPAGNPRNAGIAANYPNDVGIGGHPDVVMAHDFSPGWESSYRKAGGGFVSPGGIDYSGKTLPAGATPDTHTGWRDSPSFTAEAELGGRTTLKFWYCTEANRRGTGDVDRDGFSAIRKMTNWPVNSFDPDTEILSIRHWLKLTGVHLANQSEKIGPSIDGRYSWFTNTGEWGPLAGNGGEPTRGVFVPNFATVAQPYGTGATQVTLSELPANMRYAFSGSAQDAIFVEHAPGTWTRYSFDAQQIALTTDGSGRITTGTLSPALQAPVMPGVRIRGFWTPDNYATLEEQRWAGHYSGWSARVSVKGGGWYAGGTPADWIGDANPRKGLMPLIVYFYNPLMEGFYGDSLDVGSPALGHALLKPDRGYSIELLCRVNSLTGIPDKWGNQQAVPDGLVEVWIDGVLAFRRPNAVMRRHPFIKCLGPWIDLLQGGTAVPFTPWPLARTLGQVVAARTYIGPSKG